MKPILRNKMSYLFTSILCVLSFCMYAQKSTELYIPCGKSPGVSGKYSVMGKVEMIKIADSVITMKQETGTKSMRYTAATLIYLDKSKLKLQNKKGTWADIKPGMTAEAKYIDNKPGNPVEWIKVMIER
jgi:hypothetical protein